MCPAHTVSDVLHGDLHHGAMESRSFLLHQSDSGPIKPNTWAPSYWTRLNWVAELDLFSTWRFSRLFKAHWTLPTIYKLKHSNSMQGLYLHSFSQPCFLYLLCFCSLIYPVKLTSGLDIDTDSKSIYHFCICVSSYFWNVCCLQWWNDQSSQLTLWYHTESYRTTVLMTDCLFIRLNVSS